MTARDGKPCKKCGTSEWYKNGRCGSCRRLSYSSRLEMERERARGYSKRFRDSNPDWVREYRQHWRRANPDRVKETRRRSYQAHRSERLEESRRWRAANPQKQAEYEHNYRKRNPDLVRNRARLYRINNLDKCRERELRFKRNKPEKQYEYHRRYCQANPEKFRRYARNYRLANPDKSKTAKARRRTRERGNGGSFSVAEWHDLCAQYDGRCLRCGRQEPEIKLTVDHVLPVDLGGTSNIDNIQPLCRWCNSAKSNRHIDYRTKPLPLRPIQLSLFQGVSL